MKTPLSRFPLRLRLHLRSCLRLSAAIVVVACAAPSVLTAQEPSKRIESRTTYAKAYGETKGAVSVDAAKDLPRYPSVPPAQAIATFQVKKGFALEFAAHEPQVLDPVALSFDEHGRMYVCEMIDYSEMRDATPHLGRISRLEDRDGDGFFEHGTVFADNLAWPTGLIFASGGVFVIATPDIIFLKDNDGDEGITIWNAKSMFDAARVLGSAIRRVRDRDAVSLQQAGVDFNVSMIFGGQINGESMRLFQVYSAGNFIEATPETPYFQVGESKYGKPVLDRVITPNTPLDEAAKCALVSMDSTLKSNLSVGLPMDMVVYEVNQFQSNRIVCIDEHNPYFKMLHDSWGQKLREVFDSIEDPMWDGGQTNVPLLVGSTRSAPLRKITTPQERLI